MIISITTIIVITVLLLILILISIIIITMFFFLRGLCVAGFNWGFGFRSSLFRGVFEAVGCLQGFVGVRKFLLGLAGFHKLYRILHLLF